MLWSWKGKRKRIEVVKKRLDFLVLIIGLGLCIIYLFEFIPMQEKIELYEKELEAKQKRVFRLMEAKEKRKTLKKELVEKKEELKDLKNLFVEKPSQIMEIKDIIFQKSKEKGIKEKELNKELFEDKAYISGIWRGEFADLINFWDELERLPFILRTKKVIFWIEDDLFFELFLEIPMRGVIKSNEF